MADKVIGQKISHYYLIIIHLYPVAMWLLSILVYFKQATSRAYQPQCNISSRDAIFEVQNAIFQVEDAIF